MGVGGEIRSMLRRYSGRTAALYQGYGAYATDEMLTDAAFMTGFFGTAFALAADRLVWLMHPDAEELLPYLSIHSGEAAKFLWNPEGGLGAFDTQRVLNKPVLFEDSCSALGKKGDVNLIDPFQYILLTKGTAKQDWSIHVEFLTDQMCFRLGRQAVPGAGDRRGGGMTPERRAALLAYCRIAPGDLTAEEETLLEGLYGYAAGYMAQAGVAEPEEGTPRRAQYDLCANALVLDAWDRRDISFVGTSTAENPSFRRLLNQLKLTEPDVSNLDTSGSGGG